MKRTKVPKLTPSPRKVKQPKEVAKGKGPSSEFISLALDMSWKLAISVLGPIILGSWLTDKYNTSYYLVGGIVLGLGLGIVVIYQSYLSANQLEAKKGRQ